MTPLTPDRFHALAETWGGDLARWPADLRPAAEALLARDADARASRDRALALDALLAVDAVAPPAADLRRTILAAAEDHVGAGFLRALLRELGGLRVAGPALAASLVLGIATASMFEPLLDTATDVQAPDYAELALLDGAYEDYLP